MAQIPSIVVPIIANQTMNNHNLFDLFKNKKNIIFGVPGAFTPTCSELHLPGFIELNDKIKEQGIDEIYCMAVNDKFVMKSWLLTYKFGKKIIGIADGNCEITNKLNISSDNTKNFMGIRCKRFSMIVKNNIIEKIFIDESGVFKDTSAENILKYL